jgi:hypothetical protein
MYHCIIWNSVLYSICSGFESSINSIELMSLITFGKDMRTIIVKLAFKNSGNYNVKFPIQVNITGGIDYAHFWEFSRQIGIKPADTYVESKRIIKLNNDKLLVATTSMEGLKWFSGAEMWEGFISLGAMEKKEHYFVITIGEEKQAEFESKTVINNPEKAIESMVEKYENEVANLFSRLPKLECDNKKLEKFYYRSLVHYITNKWQVDEFVLNPYYSTGGIKGGCVGSYLWDFSGGWEIHPLYDPEGIKAQIKHYLKN